MNRIFLAFGMLIAVGILVSCDHNPLKPRVYVNRGSHLQAVQKGISAVRGYAQDHGHFPEAATNLAKLGRFSVPAEIVGMIEYGGNESLTLKSPERLILVKSAVPVGTSNGVAEYYCGLLSGEVVLLPEKDAVIGQASPQGAGKTMLPKPEG